MNGKAKGPNVWVARRGTGFIVRTEKGRLLGLRGATQKAAIAYARSLAKAYRSELIVQARSGRIRVKDSHGFDSPARKG